MEGNSPSNKKRKRLDNLLWTGEVKKLKECKTHDDINLTDLVSFQKSTPRKSVILSPKMSVKKFNPTDFLKDEKNMTISAPKFEPVIAPTKTDCPPIKGWSLISSIHVISSISLYDCFSILKPYLVFYSYPFIPMPCTLVRYLQKAICLESTKEEDSKLKDYWGSLIKGWYEAIDSLVEIVHLNQTAYFYITYSKFTILFLNSNTQLVALINTSTEKFRKNLRSKGLTTMIDTIGNDTALDSEDSTSIIHVSDKCNIDILVKLIKVEISKDNLNMPNLPILYSNNIFTNSSQCKNVITHNEVSVLGDDGEVKKGYHLDIKGVIFPHNALAIRELLTKESTDIFIKPTIFLPTEWLSELLINDDGPKLNINKTQVVL